MFASLLLLAGLTGCGVPDPSTEGTDTALLADPAAVAPIVPASCLAIAAEHPLYVMANAPEGGDGSPARPFRLLQEAVDAATNGTTVLVAPGSYARGLRAMDPRRHAELTVRGCEPETVIVKDDVVVAGYERARLRHVALVGLRLQAAMYIRNVDAFVLEDVRSTVSAGAAVVMHAGLVLRGDVAFESDVCRVVLFMARSSLSVEGSARIEAGLREDLANDCANVVYVEYSDVSVTGVLDVVAHAPRAEWESTMRVVASRMDITGTLTSTGHAAALWATYTEVNVEGALQLETTGNGGLLLNESTFVASGRWDARSDQWPTVGIVNADVSGGETGRIHGNLWVADGHNRVGGVRVLVEDGAGIDVNALASLTLTDRNHVEGAPEVRGTSGVQVRGQGTVIADSDSSLEIRGVEEGIVVRADAAADLRNTLVSSTAGVGVRVAGTVSGSDWSIEDAGAEALLAEGAQLALQRVDITRSDGIQIADGDAVLRDVRVEETRGDRSAVTLRRATIDGERLSVAGAARAGVSLIDAGGTLTDLFISDTRQSVVQWGCDADTPPLTVTGLRCEACGDDAVHRCDGAEP